jgi:hypothetical protein
MPEPRICEVHALVKGDLGVRPCRLCKGCGAWICEECWFSPDRIEAFVKHLKQKVMG